MYLSHPTLMVTAYHMTLCFCLTVSMLVSNECFCTKAVVHGAAEWAPVWLRCFSLSPLPLQFMEISLLLHCGQVALTLGLFSGAEEDCETLLSTAVQHGNVFAGLKQRDCYMVGSTKHFWAGKVSPGHMWPCVADFQTLCHSSLCPQHQSCAVEILSFTSRDIFCTFLLLQLLICWVSSVSCAAVQF